MDRLAILTPMRQFTVAYRFYSSRAYLLSHRPRLSSPHYYPRPTTMTTLANGDLAAARAAIADQVKFNIITETQDIVRL